MHAELFFSSFMSVYFILVSETLHRSQMLFKLQYVIYVFQFPSESYAYGMQESVWMLSRRLCLWRAWYKKVNGWQKWMKVIWVILPTCVLILLSYCGAFSWIFNALICDLWGENVPLPFPHKTFASLLICFCPFFIIVILQITWSCSLSSNGHYCSKCLFA